MLQVLCHAISMPANGKIDNAMQNNDFGNNITVIGAGLAGSEAAWQLARQGLHVNLYEMRPATKTAAHKTGQLAELICSNSLGSSLIDRANGLLFDELVSLGSLLVECAIATRVPAGSALAVDRLAFSALVTEKIIAHPFINVIREEVTGLPDGIAILASGPLTSSALANCLAEFTGTENLYFFDALAPIISADSIDMEIAFRASRYGRGTLPEGDYINCPFTRVQYQAFVSELVKAQRIPLRDDETIIETGVKSGSKFFFERCVPVEVMAGYSEDALAYGPMKPFGLKYSSTIQNPYAILQLRQDDLAGDLYNMVGFQTNLTFAEQERIFRMVPGLQHAHFIRHGQMHRNTYLNAPVLLEPTLQFRRNPNLIGAGQIIGAEGYLGNIATGLYAGITAARLAMGETPAIAPRTMMLGALIHYLTHADPKHFQPMKANFGLLYNEFTGKQSRQEKIQIAIGKSQRSRAEFLKRVIPSE